MVTALREVTVVHRMVTLVYTVDSIRYLGPVSDCVLKYTVDGKLVYTVDRVPVDGKLVQDEAGAVIVHQLLSDENGGAGIGEVRAVADLVAVEKRRGGLHHGAGRDATNERVGPAIVHTAYGCGGR